MDSAPERRGGLDNLDMYWAVELCSVRNDGGDAFWEMSREGGCQMKISARQDLCKQLLDSHSLN